MLHTITGLRILLIALDAVRPVVIRSVVAALAPQQRAEPGADAF